MKKRLKNKILRIATATLGIFLVSIFCFETVAAYQNNLVMPIQAHSYKMDGGDLSQPMRSADNMMPCCGDSEHHDLAIDVSSSKNFTRQLVALGSVVEPVDLAVSKNIFSNTSYELPAPPGPDILSAVVKKE